MIEFYITVQEEQACYLFICFLRHHYEPKITFRGSTNVHLVCIQAKYTGCVEAEVWALSMLMREVWKPVYLYIKAPAIHLRHAQSLTIHAVSWGEHLGSPDWRRRVSPKPLLTR